MKQSDGRGRGSVERKKGRDAGRVCSLRISHSSDSAQHFEKRLRIDSIHFPKSPFNIQNQAKWAFVIILTGVSVPIRAPCHQTVS